MNKTQGTSNRKNKKELYTRDELLGGVNKAFTLGDSEIIANRIIDFILKLVVDKARLNYVESLMPEYIIDKTFAIFRNMVDSRYVSPDPELEYNNKNYEIKFEVMRPK